MENNYNLGKYGEKLALEYYLNAGYEMVVQNFQYYRQGTQGRLGEIDLIMLKDKKLFLIEVKARSSSQFGYPVEQVNKSKLKYLYKTYQYFLIKHKQYKNYFCQFDVVSILDNQISVFANAYSFEDVGF
jgi:putative endonuclease